jgi:hypothetical protein
MKIAPCLLLLLALWTSADDVVPASSNAAHRDPYVPPAARKPTSNAPAGRELQAMVADKLSRRFAAADVEHAGSITLKQAQAANWGYVAEHFDAIDSRHNGRVSLADIQRHLRAAGARF